MSDIKEHLATESIDVDSKKIGFNEIFSLVSNETVGRFLNFQDKLMKGDYKGLFTLLQNGDAVATSVLFWTCVSAAIIAYYLWNSHEKDASLDNEKKSDVSNTIDSDEPLRDFTVDQLREFDGSGEKKIYIAIKGDVYDVSSSREMYGPDSSYNCFAGRDATRALAKLSFEEADLSNPRYDDLGPFELESLNSWIEKFKYYRSYPIIGKLSYPPEPRNFNKKELLTYDGSQPIPEGRIDAPIYVSINKKVFDVSYGGKENYDSKGPYHIFAGKDASRAFAMMSLKEEEVNNSDVSDLTETQLKTLADWEKKFISSKKYPIVGVLVEED